MFKMEGGSFRMSNIILWDWGISNWQFEDKMFVYTY